MVCLVRKLLDIITGENQFSTITPL